MQSIKAPTLEKWARAAFAFGLTIVVTRFSVWRMTLAWLSKSSGILKLAVQKPDCLRSHKGFLKGMS
jgi:hypothetical protein